MIGLLLGQTGGHGFSLLNRRFCHGEFPRLTGDAKSPARGT